MPRELHVWAHRMMGILLALMLSTEVMWSLPQTQDLKGVVIGINGHPLADAHCTLKGESLAAEGISMATGELGRFEFPGLQPGQYNLVCAAVGHLPVTETGIKVGPGNPAELQVVLPDAQKLRQTIEVHETASPVAAETTIPSQHVTSQQLNSLPLVQEQFLAALPLVPGVVRSPDGRITIKGSVESQSMLLIDNTEMVDPITGSYSIDLPLDAI